MKGMIFVLAFVMVSSIVPVVLAGTNYDCQYPVSINVDGNLSDWAGIEFITVPHDMGTSAATDDADASFEFAAVADADWLYVAIDVTDDSIRLGKVITGKTTQ